MTFWLIFFLNRCTDKLLTVRCIIIICYIYIALFWVLKALHIEGGDLLNHHQCAASTWMWRQPYWSYIPDRPPHTSLLVERRQRWLMKPISVCMGMVRRSWCSEANGEIWPGCRGYICIFNNHRETEPRFNAPPAGLTNTPSSSNLVFPGGLPSRYWPAQPCLASVGNRSWAAGQGEIAAGLINKQPPFPSILKKGTCNCLSNNSYVSCNFEKKRENCEV